MLCGMNIPGSPVVSERVWPSRRTSWVEICEKCLEQLPGDVHTEHCCSHKGCGCKYGDLDCTVTSGKLHQRYEHPDTGSCNGPGSYGWDEDWGEEEEEPIRNPKPNPELDYWTDVYEPVAEPAPRRVVEQVFSFVVTATGQRVVVAGDRASIAALIELVRGLQPAVSNGRTAEMSFEPGRLISSDGTVIPGFDLPADVITFPDVPGAT